jgi:general secretion pathway protein L
MKRLVAVLSSWLDAVAAAMINARPSNTRARRVQMTQQSDGSFLLEADDGASAESTRITIGPRSAVVPDTKAASLLSRSHVEIELMESRLVTRILELPRAGVEFLEGIIRSQIDRLTPWQAAEAVCGWTEPRDIGPDQIRTTVVAAPHSLLLPCIELCKAAGAASIDVRAVVKQNGKIERAGLLTQNFHVIEALPRLRRLLVRILSCAAAVGVASLLITTILQQQWEDEEQSISRSVAEKRNLLKRLQEAPGVEADLRARKASSIAAVLVLNRLAEVLPDDTYVHDLRLEGNAVQIVGSTRDAPSLIKRLEGAPSFAHAMLFAPTTRSPADAAEEYHIKVQLRREGLSP